jgi:hypothetical protein
MWQRRTHGVIVTPVTLLIVYLEGPQALLVLNPYKLATFQMSKRCQWDSTSNF